MICFAALLCVLPFIFAGSRAGLSKAGLGGLAMLYLFSLLALGMPIGMAMLVSGMSGMLLIMPNISLALSMAGTGPYYSVASVTMSVIPMFILMGELALFGNVSADLFRTASTWVGRLPGGLGVASVWGCAGFAAVCGDSLATGMAMASVAMPSMRERNYNPAFAAACLSAGGPLGILIPPSIGFIIYAVITEVSVGKLFLAGIIPGLMLTTLLSSAIVFRCILNPSLAPAGEAQTWSQKFRSLTGVLPMLLLFFIIMGGMFTGFCSPTEGGAIGSFACLIYCYARGRLGIRELWHALTKTTLLTGKIFVILMGVAIIGYLLAATRLPFALSDFVVSSGTSKYVLLVGIIIMYLILGMLMNVMPMVMLTLPSIFPSVIAMGFDPVWFGVIVVLLVELGQITPPVGIIVYGLASTVPDVSLASIFWHVAVFFVCILFAIFLLILFPDIALFLPNTLL